MGLSQRAVAERLATDGYPGVSQMAVSRTLRRAPATPRGSPAASTATPAKVPPRPSKRAPVVPAPSPAPSPPRAGKRQRAAPVDSSPPPSAAPPKTRRGAAPPSPPPRSAPPSPEIVAAFVRATSEEVIALEQAEDIAPGTIDQLRRRQRQVGQIADALVDDVYAGTYQATQWKQLIGLEQDLAQRIMRIIPPELPDPETDPNNVETRDAFVARIERSVSELEREPIIRQSMRRHLDELDARAEAEVA